MYFKTEAGRVYHVLCDKASGRATCGARLSKLDVFCLAEGRPTPSVVEELPQDAQLCKHCEEEEKSERGAEPRPPPTSLLRQSRS